MFSKREAAVLDAPERRHAPESGRLRRDLSEDFAEDPEEDAPVRRRGGVRVRFGGLPRNRRGWIVAVAMALLSLAVCVGILVMARDFLLQDERFVIPSSSSIEFQGNEHVTRAQLLRVFGGDIERNIFKVPLAERRTELEQMPWVAHATVMRLLPTRLRVSVVERTPVAFVRQGNHIGLVDASGVLLEMPVQAKGAARYSFPVVTGIEANDPLSTRAARMKTFNRFTSDLDSAGDSAGEKISQGLSEVDLSNPEDVKALIPDHSMDILVHFGDTDFLGRYRRFEEHLPEWRTVYPKLSSVDMRYDRQVVLEMQPGSAVPSSIPMTSSTNAGETTPAADASGTAASVGAAARSSGAEVKGRPVAKREPVAKTPAHGKAHREGAFSVTSKKSAVKGGVKSKPHTAAAARHPTVVVRPAPGAPRYHPSQAVDP